jgi:hypothetical protein
MKRSIYHNQVGFISGMQAGFNIPKFVNVICHLNRMKGKNHKISQYRKAADKIQHLYIIESTQQTRKELT